jgi:hypothetical protein
MKIQPQTVLLIADLQKQHAIVKLQNTPVGMGMEMVIRKTTKGRTLDQQALLFAGPMKDISQQAWVEKRQFSVEIWHNHCKREYLPEDDDPYIFELVKDCEKYHKWAINPKGERELVGSTTELSKYGYSLYLEQIHALGASMGVMFTAKE